ncbi:MAG: radical SAM protein [Bdellovibrionales bacterium]|nr:radical SAM protein [Bdellovibrionales bacterium]
MLRLLLVTPPLTQLNTPYPATTTLTGTLRARGWDLRQADPGLELVLRLLSKDGLARVRENLGAAQSEAVDFFREAYSDYERTVEPVIRFLQGADPTLAYRLAARTLVPEGPRFQQFHEETVVAAFGHMGTQDRAKYVASLYVDDLADVIREGIDPRFALSRYGEKLAASQPSFEPLASALAAAPTLVDELLDEITRELIAEHQPDVLGLSLPFPGNVYAGLRMAREAKRAKPTLVTVAGGGYVNTELRELAEPRVFDYWDYVTLDDGERPLECVLEHLSGKRPRSALFRTFTREAGAVRFTQGTEHDLPFREGAPPTLDGLPLSRYLSLLEMPNPIHRLWSDLKWNKVTLAHGCYWKRCSFCDVNLDYIGRYEAAPAELTLDRMQALARESGQTGFHLTDEAAPPAALKALGEAMRERCFTATWWGNIRFDKAFTPELCGLMADSGCVAVTGGIEVASDRLLKLMRKGVTIEQVARVSRALRDAGILVHAYLMYGFPTQTLQETVDSLEVVRQLFAEDCLQSAFWHRFSATVHSPVGRDPAAFGITLLPEGPEAAAGPGKSAPRFARNDLPFHDPTGTDHEACGAALRKALYNYMLGYGLDTDVREWFQEFMGSKARVPKTTERPDRIRRALER